ncbi:hypothetical protein RF11_12739 [Thelohanellus kitauei]|uniref:Uncharacterized protein n=1 Tax=Thelohanellus kitauei TaxID=669202 RepID=A0A0C2MC99_THEKT|nr:hypothetical protein RF11_12739 [Thelohanellus kitauei]
MKFDAIETFIEGNESAHVDKPRVASLVPAKRHKENYEKRNLIVYWPVILKDWLTKLEQSNNPVEMHKEKEIVSPPIDPWHPPNTYDNSVGRIRRNMKTLSLSTVARPCRIISATLKDSTSE